jgi:TfoX/Sxy family transcriptional regulator of competence genes
MASDLSFVEFIVEQIESAGEITYKKMFGEYGLYSDGIIMALICDDQLFIKPTDAGRAFINDLEEAPPYPGAKPYFLIENQFDDREWISNLVRVTVEELKTNKPKAKRKK